MRNEDEPLAAPPTTDPGSAFRRGVQNSRLSDREPLRARGFADLRSEWRTMFNEFFGTFLLVAGSVNRGPFDAVSRTGRKTAAGNLPRRSTPHPLEQKPGYPQ